MFSTISAKYQLTIPKKIRKELNIKVGQKFTFIPKGNIIILVLETNLSSLKGYLMGANPVDDQS